MARSYTIAGIRFFRRSLIKLSQAERQQLSRDTIVVARPVEWPLASSLPDFEAAYVDPGGTDIWGPGPYLKVPNRVADCEAVNRVFSPWGYPPDRIRLARSSTYLQIMRIELVRDAPASWFWRLTLVHIPETSGLCP